MKLNILHVIDYLGPGGAQTIVQDYLKSHNTTHNTFLYALRKRDENIVFNSANINIHHSKSRFSLLPILEIRKYVIENRINVLHCHLFRSQVFGWIVQKIFFPKIVLIFHEHGQILQNNWYYDFIFRLIKPDCYIAVSRIVSKTLSKKLGVKDDFLHTVENYINFDKFKIHKKSGSRLLLLNKFKLEKDVVLLGFIGRLAPVKGCDDAIRVMEKFNKSVHLVIIGSGQMLNELLELTESLGLSDRVHFWGYDINAYNLISGLDIVLVPSRSESFGLTVLESQISRTPVVASDVGGLSEVIEDRVSGLLYKSGDISIMYKNIQALIMDRVLYKEIQNGGYLSVKKYSLLKFSSKLNHVYDVAVTKRT